MNRKERRAASKRSIAAPNGAEGLDEMLAQARHHYQQGALTTAELNRPGLSGGYLV